VLSGTLRRSSEEKNDQRNKRGENATERCHLGSAPRTRAVRLFIAPLCAVLPCVTRDLTDLVLHVVDSGKDRVNAALNWLRAHPLIDAERIAMIGSSYGGVMVMLAAGRHARFRAGISFAGPSITWPDAPALQTMLLAAMGVCQVPLMLIQAGDDFHLTPTYVLGGELARLGKPHETRIYQTIGSQRGDGHGVFNKALWLWRPDVEAFLRRWV
jgi:hypothetical protein